MILTVCALIHLTTCLLPSTTLEISRSLNILRKIHFVNSGYLLWLMRKINWMNDKAFVRKFLSDDLLFWLYYVCCVIKLFKNLKYILMSFALFSVCSYFSKQIYFLFTYVILSARGFTCYNFIDDNSEGSRQPKS